MDQKNKFAPFNIVLLNPEIPQNTGNIGRLCVCSGSRLHIVGERGFSLEDKYVKRAGMDYWKNVDFSLYENWEEFLKVSEGRELYFFSTKTERTIWDCPAKEGAFLVFGNESSGLPPAFYESYRDRLYTIPMYGEYSRSLNLSNAVSVVLYESIRKNLKGNF